jgi:hypothetical protein
MIPGFPSKASRQTTPLFAVPGAKQVFPGRDSDEVHPHSDHRRRACGLDRGRDAGRAGIPAIVIDPRQTYPSVSKS